MGSIWTYPHGSALLHPLWDQYGVHVGMPIWACPVTSHIWDEYGVRMGMPIWACPVTPHIGPIWGSCGRAHLGLPSHTPYGTNMGVLWACCPVVAHMGPILSCLLGIGLNLRTLTKCLCRHKNQVNTFEGYDEIPYRLFKSVSIIC